MVAVEIGSGFETGSGFWSPLIWVSILVVAFLLMYLLRSRGKTGYKEDTEQRKPFLSGNVAEKEALHIKASNVYWGFTETLQGVYRLLRRVHTGNASDYVLWFIIILAVFFVVVGVIP